MITSEALAAALARHGVDTMFSQCFPVRTQHVAPKYGIRQIGFRTENAGGYMADGYARLSNKVAVLAGQSGPAATLLVPPMCEALKSSIPMLVLVEEFPGADADRNVFQEFDHFALFAGCSKWTRRVTHPARLDDYVDMAMVQATTGRPGPVVLLLPSDFMGMEAVPAPHRTARLGTFPLDRVQPEPSRIAEAASLIRAARRPLVIAGGGVWLSQAQDELAELAARGSLPVATTNHGKGVIADTSPLSLGVFGNCMGEGSVAGGLRAYATEADLVLFVGTRTAANGTANWTLFPREAAFIHIDIDGTEIGRNYEALRLVGDCKATLAALLGELGEGDFPDREARMAQLAQDTARARAASAAAVEAIGGGRQGAVRPEHLMRVLDGRLAGDDIVVADASYSTNWIGSYLSARAEGGRFLTPRGLAGLGWGMPMAMGARLARPDARVFALVGDGGFAHVWSELETARRLDIPVITIVLNNQILAYQKHGEEWFMYHHSDASDLGPVDHAMIARACGCHGERVTSPEQFAPALDRALASGLPAVIDVLTDEEARPPLGQYAFRPPAPAA
jgi:acetolactate synthase I/II/III large subunit